MTRCALIVTGEDPRAFQRATASRLHQVRELYRGLGFRCDLLLLRPEGVVAQQGQRDLDWGLIARANPDGEGGIAAHRIAQVSREMRRGEGHALVHFDRIAPAEAVAGARTVLDAVDGGLAIAGAADLVLGAVDAVRSAWSSAGAASVRLPLLPSLRHVPAPGSAIGWVGTWSDEIAADWAACLDAMSRRAIDLPEGLLLAAPSAPPPEVTRAMRPFGRALPDVEAAAVVRASGLSLMPGHNIQGQLAGLTEMVWAGRPVLLGPDLADLFEGRWRTPTAEDPDAIAEAAGQWRDGRETHVHAAEATRAAFMDDAAAMTAYVSSRIAAML